MPTVFVVDGGAMRGTPLLRTVREAGYHTLPMANADMALAVLRAIRADLLLIDLRDAKVGGPRLIEEVRRNEELRQMPILAVGAQPGSEELRRLKRRVGIGHVLADGEYSPDELLVQMQKYLSRPADLAGGATMEWTN